MAAKGVSRIGFYVVIGLLLIGLVGFGATGLTSTTRTIAEVGDREVTAQQFANSLNEQLRSLSSTLGQPITMEQARSFGIDRMVLSQLVTEASLDHEAQSLGLSVGDAEVRDRVLSTRDFAGLDGQFDREQYRQILRNNGLSEAQFETEIRAETARSLLQAAVVSGIPEPDVYADTMAAWMGERRSPTWARITAGDLALALPEPTEEELRTYWEETPAPFTTPETRRITYAWLTPSMLGDAIDVPEEDVRALYDQRIDEFVQPERRLVERLVMPSPEAAAEALAALDAGETNFQTLVSDRGLALSDVDLGDVGLDDLGPAGEAVFAVEPGEVAGPVDTDLGPALFRVNAVLAAQEVPFDEAAVDLRAELATDRARRLIEQQSETLTDLIAGGASLEDLAERTDLELGTIDWSTDVTDGIAAYENFRAAAAGAEEGAFPEVLELSDGGIFALRLDEVIAPAQRPFDEVRDEVAAAWTAAAERRAVLDHVETLAATIRDTGQFAVPGRGARTDFGILRGDFLEGRPEDFVPTLFEMTEGEVRILPVENGAIILRLDAIGPADPDSPTLAAQRDSLLQSTGQGIAQDIYAAFAIDVQESTEISVNDGAIESVLSQFR